MKIRERTVGTVSVLYLHGKMAGETEVATLHDALQALAERGTLSVVLNLEYVPWVDSGGIGGLIRAYYAFVRRGGRLKLCALSTRVEEALWTIDLRNVFDVYRTESEAVAALSTRLTEPDSWQAHGGDDSAPPVGG